MENKLSIFAYNGNNITFKSDNGIMVSATEMAKTFGKQTSDWTRQKSTFEFLDSLSAVRGIPISDLILTIHGGSGVQGTWMHEDVAIEFARWLSPKFAIWCNDKIKELMQNGVATINDDDEMIARAMNILQNRLDAKQRELAKANEVIAEQAPKALFADSVSASETSILVGDMAKLLNQNGINIGQNRLFDWLRKNDYLCSKGEMRNMPTQKTMDMGLMEIKERSVINPDGSVRITRTPKIKGKGQIYFVNKFVGRTNKETI